MGTKSGMALKFIQWFIRAIQFCCAAIILALFSYFLATMANHNIHIANWIRAVEGISGAAVLYTLLGLLLLCCVAGHPFTSFFAILLDICFIAGFIYIAVSNGRTGTDSCRGHVNTVFGSGNADRNVPDNNTGFTALPSLRQACQMQTAVLAVSIVGIIFFLMSALMEVALVRHHRKEKRFGPGPANGYTSGYGSKLGGGGFLGRFGRKRHAAGMAEDPNALPVHATPNDVRDSYATEQTRVEPGYENGTNGTNGYNKYEQSGFAPAPAAAAQPAAAVNPYRSDYSNGLGGAGNGTAVNDTATAHAQYPAGNYRYDDGVYNNGSRV
ncbi:hypothetical protein GE09DRAFT_1093710 [Coniochaeta sp. 2T2.1]|nr:hypothetical protein GE09DRAFT_1093710 [Coniochaeta sp. 2T2.1]